MSAYAQVTLAISDGCPGGLEGFAPLSDALDAAVFEAAAEDGLPADGSGSFHAVYLDLMDGRHNQVGEKCISLIQAAAILGREPEELIPLGRQRLSQLNDEYAQRVRAACLRAPPASPAEAELSPGITSNTGPLA